MADTLSNKIDAEILKWDCSFAEVAERLGIAKTQVRERWDTHFAVEARRMITEGATTEVIRTKLGLPATAIAAFRAGITRRQNEGELEVVQSVEVSIGLERDLQKALRAKIAQLESGLRIVDDDVEVTTDAGRVDILARDKEDRLVVIELKLGEADRAAIGQIMGYMGALGEAEQEPVRGILVAESFAKRIVHAAKLIPQLKLMEYSLAFSFKKLVTN